VVTQDLKLSSVQDIIERGRPQTLENIVQKTNMKLGGLNYSIIITEPGLKDLFGPATLYLGLAMSHPGSVSDYERPRGTSLQYSAPSVIGYAANMMKHPFEFVGDCLYGEPRRDEKVWIIKKFDYDLKNGLLFMFMRILGIINGQNKKIYKITPPIYDKIIFQIFRS
jgi:hypothetical protein